MNAAGDELQAQLAQLRPPAPPTIDRAAPPIPPAPPPPAPAPDLIATVRTFLAPEIREGLVVVDGDAQRLMVRIKGRGMFASGSSEVQPRFVTLLNRIGEALKTEKGRVMVVGHTDNQPIRTVASPRTSSFRPRGARARRTSSPRRRASPRASRPPGAPIRNRSARTRRQRAARKTAASKSSCTVRPAEMKAIFAALISIRGLSGLVGALLLSTLIWLFAPALLGTDRSSCGSC